MPDRKSFQRTRSFAGIVVAPVLRSRRDELHRAAKRHQAELEKLRKRLDRLVTMRADGEISKEEFAAKRAEVDQAITAVEAASYKVQAELVSGESATAELVVRAVRTLLAGKTSLTEPERREILAAATTRIDVTVRKIDQFFERDPLGRWKGTKPRYALETVEFALGVPDTQTLRSNTISGRCVRVPVRVAGREI